MLKGAGGLTFQIVNKTEFSNIVTFVPSIGEQKKIGYLFYKLDNLITLHQRKVFNYHMNFQLILIDLFYSWEQRKLIELGKVETGNTPSTSIKDYYSEDGLNWVTPTDITSNITFTTEKKLSKKGEQVGRVIPANSILCTCIASIGKNTFSPVKCAFNQQINALIPSKDNDPYFLFVDS